MSARVVTFKTTTATSNERNDEVERFRAALNNNGLALSHMEAAAVELLRDIYTAAEAYVQATTEGAVNVAAGELDHAVWRFQIISRRVRDAAKKARRNQQQRAQYRRMRAGETTEDFLRRISPEQRDALRAILDEPFPGARLADELDEKGGAS